MGKKRRSQVDILTNEIDARNSTPDKKHFSVHDIKTIKPRTTAQREAFESYFYDNNLALIGSAGTGKTFLAMWLSLNEVLSKTTTYDKAVIIRSAVTTRNIGFLPGTEEEKMAIFERPYISICNELFNYSKSYENLKKAGYLEFESTSALRGITYDNCILVVDEAQNMNINELDTIITRLGNNSKIIFSGDTRQDDLENYRNDASGLPSFIRILDKMKEFEIINFTHSDIVRSSLVRNYIIQKDNLRL